MISILKELNAFVDSTEMCGGFVVTDGMCNNVEYNGSESKFGITVGNTDYIVKCQKKDWNNVLSEVIASRLFKIVAFVVTIHG